ncbi:hypothetical protein HGB47_14870 [Leptospira yasudae]|uniref:hypothetical protein n=1 Tax=Leptospira yasudae TaxID=2202201 RepID=UPI001C500FFB|nr:hypothetical protein [Leptospira yasudae]MBW0434899.1 hypothetical protein [Leptospira yasudae]
MKDYAKKEKMNTESIRRRLKILSTALLNSSHDDAEGSLEEIYNFILETPLLKDFIEENQDRKYSEEELFVGRDWYRFKIPGTTKGRIGFTWSLIEHYLTDSRLEYWQLAKHYGGPGSNNVSRHVRPFNEAVIMPLLQLLESHLIDKSDSNDSPNLGLSIGYIAGGNVQISHNSNNVNQTIESSGVSDLFKEIYKEVNESDYVRKEELTGIMEVYLGDITNINKKRSFIKVLINKLKDFNAIVTGSTAVYNGIKYLEEVYNITNMD